MLHQSWRTHQTHSWRKVYGDAPSMAPLRKEDAEVRPKSQSEASDGIQSLDDAHRHFRESLQVVYYRHALKQVDSLDLVKHYVNGELAVILDLVIRRKVNEVGAVTVDRPS